MLIQTVDPVTLPELFEDIVNSNCYDEDLHLRCFKGL